MFLNNLCVSSPLIVFLLSNVYLTSGGRDCFRDRREHFGSRSRSRHSHDREESSCPSGSWSPKSDKRKLESSLRELFSSPRYSPIKPPTELRDKLLSLGFEDVIIQKPYSNLVLTLPGKKWRTSEDKILLIGAHWDTRGKAPVSIIPLEIWHTCM